MDRLADLHDEFRGDPAGLRSTLEQELAWEVITWAQSPASYAAAQSLWADAAWVSLNSHRWWVLSRSSKETVALLGTDTARRYTDEATRLEVIALNTGDWSWACDQLQHWLRSELESA